jgi:flagellar FliL protein
MAEAKAADTAPSESTPSGGGGGKLVLILTLVNVVASLAMIALLVITFNRDMKKPQVADIDPNAAESTDAKKDSTGTATASDKKKDGHFGKMITLEQFTINLSTPGSMVPKFVRANISLEVPTDDAEAELNAKMPQVRNVIIDLFNSKRASDLAGTEGREFLKDEIKNAINSFMITGKVKGVFFTNFAVTS